MKRTLLLSTMVFLGAAPLQAEDPPPLPAPILSALDANYPGWHLTPINTRLIAREHRNAYSNLLHADINADGKEDIIVEVNYIDGRSDVQTAAVAFIADGQEYQEYRLTDIWVGSDHKLTFAPSETVLRFMAKGKSGYRAGEENPGGPSGPPAAPYKTNVIEVITLNKAVTALAFDGTGFSQVRKANAGQDRE